MKRPAAMCYSRLRTPSRELSLIRTLWPGRKTGNDDIIDGTYIDADARPALPGPSDDEEPAEEQTEEPQPAEEEGTDEPTEEQSGEPAEEEPEDITDDILGDTDTEGYDYEDPEE